MSSAEKTPVSLADLPPCPVETTLTLISDKWKVKSGDCSQRLDVFLLNTGCEMAAVTGCFLL